MGFLKKLNHYGQKLSKITYFISNANAVNEALHGNLKPINNKAKRKIKKKIIDKIL